MIRDRCAPRLKSYAEPTAQALFDAVAVTPYSWLRSPPGVGVIVHVAADAERVESSVTAATVTTMAPCRARDFISISFRSKALHSLFAPCRRRISGIWGSIRTIAKQQA